MLQSIFDSDLKQFLRISSFLYEKSIKPNYQSLVHVPTSSSKWSNIIRYPQKTTQNFNSPRRIDLLRQRLRLRSLELPVATSATTPTRSVAPTPIAGLRQHGRTGRRRHPQQLNQRLHRRGRRGIRRGRRRVRRRHRVGRGPRESIVDQKLASGVLLLLGVGRGVVLVGLVVLTVVVRMLLLLVGKGLLQQDLLAVVMAGATGAGAGCIAAVAAAAVCAVRNHLRCASGVCLILEEGRQEKGQQLDKSNFMGNSWDER